jgi:7-keto-8-aminopelargonate synthetase-like enzyme
VIVCDGVYVADGQPAPLRAIAELADRFDAAVYVDDAHGIGLFGGRPTPAMPYGFGGAGTPAYAAAPAGTVTHVGSLSKALGVPLAFVAGPAGFISHLRRTAPSHMHSSPPSVPMLAAALAALRFNAVVGDALRRYLLDRVRQFRGGLARMPVRLSGNPDFPIQAIRFGSAAAGLDFARHVRRAGVWPVVQVSPVGSAVRFVVTAHHDAATIDEALHVISSTLSRR